MPVWHELTRGHREEGLLEVVGVVTEQHPQRARLFAQWKGIEWPLLWDPFNLTGSEVVPNHVFVDEHGIVRSTAPSSASFEDELLFAEFPPPAMEPGARAAGARLVELARHAEASFEHAHHRALSDLLWREGASLDEAIETLEAQAAERPADPRLAFRAGVARRMRFDSAAARPGDFQAAVDHWARALAANPSQYIWRRRIQQYGPRMDKPYNFYSWIEQAEREVAARGEEPIRLVATLTPTELAEKRVFEPAGGDAEEEEPDPEGAVPRDERGLISVETAVAFDTSGEGRVASVNLALRPNARLAAHWNHEADALRVWVAPPDGWRIDRRLLEDPPRSDVAVSDELRSLSLEVELPSAAEGGELEAYALYYVCEGADGKCLFLRQDFRVRMRRP